MYGYTAAAGSIWRHHGRVLLPLAHSCAGAGHIDETGLHETFSVPATAVEILRL